MDEPKELVGDVMDAIIDHWGDGALDQATFAIAAVRTYDADQPGPRAIVPVDTDMREAVARAIQEYDPYTAVFDFDSPNRDVSIVVLREQQADAAITAVLMMMAEEAKGCAVFSDTSMDTEYISDLADWVRSFLPSQPEVTSDAG